MVLRENQAGVTRRMGADLDNLLTAGAEVRRSPALGLKMATPAYPAGPRSCGAALGVQQLVPKEVHSRVARVQA
jgi:hypothetical protein